MHLKTQKNYPKKLYTYVSWEAFFSAAPTAQNSPELQLCFINYFIIRSLYESYSNPNKIQIWFYEIFLHKSVLMDNLGNTLSNRRHAEFKCVPDLFCFFAYLPRRQNKMDEKSLPKVPSMSFYRDFIEILSRFYRDFIEILS